MFSSQISSDLNFLLILESIIPSNIYFYNKYYTYVFFFNLSQKFVDNNFNESNSHPMFNVHVSFLFSFFFLAIIVVYFLNGFGPHFGLESKKTSENELWLWFCQRTWQGNHELVQRIKSIKTSEKSSRPKAPFGS